MKIAFIGDSLTEGIPGSSYLDLIQTQFPSYLIANFGKGGDTIISVYKRVHKISNLSEYDHIFFFIGVNDVFSKLTNRYKLLKLLMRERWSKDISEFNNYYKKTLEYLSTFSVPITVISPLVIGENIDNRWNQQIAEINKNIKQIITSFPMITYLDIHHLFIEKLNHQTINDFLPLRIRDLAKDVTLSHSNDKITNKSHERGLHLTLDGVHLNPQGANIVAGAIIDFLNTL